jgi:aerobic carbon-monoxide dehydrogenase small subunit
MANGSRVQLALEINGRPIRSEIEPRMLLVEFIREVARLTGTHVGCDTSYCGACTILLDGRAVKSCTLLALQAAGAQLTTVEGLAQGGVLHPLQVAFARHHALQCGFCTPGFLMAAVDLLAENRNPSEEAIRKGLSGNTCRCTGYVNIIAAVRDAAEELRKATA